MRKSSRYLLVSLLVLGLAWRGTSIQAKSQPVRGQTGIFESRVQAPIRVGVQIGPSTVSVPVQSPTTAGSSKTRLLPQAAFLAATRSVFQTSTTTMLFPVDLGVTAVESIDPVVAGSGSSNLRYVITVTNAGPGDATGVVLNESLTLPTGVSVDSFSAGGSTTFSGTTWTVGDLAVGAMEQLTINLSAGPSAPDASEIISETSVIGANETLINSGDDSAVLQTLVRRSVDLMVTANGSAPVVTAGSGAENLTYVATVHNSGPSDASDVQISDVFSAAPGVSVLRAVAGGGTSFSGTNWTVGTLPAGATQTLTITIGVGPATAAGATLVNTVTVVSSAEDLFNNGDDSASVSTSVVRSVDLVLTPSASTSAVTAGSGQENLTHTITLTNLGPSNASGIQVQDVLSLPGGVSVDRIAAGGGSSFSGTIWSLGELAAGAGSTLVVTITAGPGAASGSAIVSTATVLSAQEPLLNSGTDSVTLSTPVARTADLVLTVTASSPSVVAGSGPENLSYVVTITNRGPSNASAVVVTTVSLLPAGVSINRITPAAGTSFLGTTWTVGGLAAGSSRSLTVVGTVTPAAAAGVDVIEYTASVLSAAETLINTDDDSVRQRTAIERSTSLVVNQTTSAGLVVAGSGVGNLMYQIQILNRGPSDATNVSLSTRLILPPGVNVERITPEPSTSFSGSEWRIGALPAGERRTLTIEVTATSSAPAGSNLISSTVTVMNPGELPADEAGLSSTLTASIQRRADVMVRHRGTPGQVLTGNRLPYVVEVTNAGPSLASGVVLTERLPAGVTFLRSEPALPACNLAGQTLTCQVGELAPGQIFDVSILVELDVNNSGVFDNQSTVTGLEEDPDPSNNLARDAAAVLSEADLSVSMSGAPNVILAGELLRYRLTVRNAGPARATQVRFIERFPQNAIVLELNASPSGSCSVSDTLLTCLLPDLSQGETATIDLVLRPAPQGGFLTTLHVSSANVDPLAGNNDLEFQTRVDPSADLSVLASAASRAIASRLFVYRLILKNDGPSDATGVVVTSLLAQGVSFDHAESEVQPVCSTSGNLLTCMLGEIKAASMRQLRIVVEVGPALRGTFLNSTEVMSNELDPGPENNRSATSSFAVVLGDANGDNVIDAADMVALILELNDGDGDDVNDAEGGSFAGSPALDINGDGRISLLDYIALIRMTFARSPDSL